jgi:hypothetical protein
MDNTDGDPGIDWDDFLAALAAHEHWPRLDPNRGAAIIAADHPEILERRPYDWAEDIDERPTRWLVRLAVGQLGVIVTTTGAIVAVTLSSAPVGLVLIGAGIVIMSVAVSIR